MTHKCNRCGTELKVVEVQVPVRETIQHDDYVGSISLGPITRYETREEVADCPRCTGGY